MNYQFFLFDWDGCLGKTLEVWLAAYRATFREFGLDPTDKEIASIFGDWQGALKLGVQDNEAYAKRLVEHVAEGSKTVKLYPGALSILRDLRARHKHIALLTSSVRPIIEASLKYNQVEKYFDVVLTAEDVTNHKPDPEIIETALARLNGRKSEAVMIGDSDKDILAATNAGIDSILMYPASHKLFYDLSELKVLNPTHTFAGFEAMARAMERPDDRK